MAIEPPSDEPDTALPEPDSDELRLLVSGHEAREAYRWLYEHRHDPQPMSAWVERSRERLGKTNSNTGRRLRDLYSAFEVKRYKQPGSGMWVYELVSRRAEQIDSSPISKRLEVEVYALKGRWCAMCAKRAADGIELQIDHVVPREWGGETVLANLEPLCVPHNHAKKAFYSTFDEVGPLIRSALDGNDPWTRIGELLLAFRAADKPCPVELVNLVARETHKGDPKKRLRELRYILGWPISWTRSKDASGVTRVSYYLTGPAPAWPSGGPSEAILRHERDRKAARRQKKGAE